MISKVCEQPNRLDAIEIRDSDSIDWMVLLVAVTADPRTEHHLVAIRTRTPDLPAVRWWDTR